MQKQHQECFAESSRDLGHCKILTYQINTGTGDKIHQQPHPPTFKERELLQTQKTQMLKDEVIEPSNSPWLSPVILVKKKDVSYRFCVDYIKLNNVTIKDVYPLPRIDDALSRLEKTKYFSIMDMQSGFWQIEVHPYSKEKTALDSGSAEDVAAFFVTNLVLIISYRGKIFMAELVQQMLKLLDTDHLTTTSYHPQTNGLCERLNHTMADMLTMYVSTNHNI